MSAQKPHNTYLPLKAFLQVLLFACGFWFANAAPSFATAPSCTMADFGEALAARESGGSYSALNSYGYAGKYQMGGQYAQEAGLGTYSGSGKTQDWDKMSWDGPIATKYGITSIDAFLASSEAQEAAFTASQSGIWNQIQSKGLTSYVGQTVNGVTITESSLLAGCHLKGCGGLSACLNGTGSCTDGYGTSVYEYMDKFAGYETPFGGTASCNPSASNYSPRSDTYGNPMCAEDIRADVKKTIQASSQKMADFKTTNATMPQPVSTIANTPCMSKELTSLTSKFASAPSQFVSSTAGSLIGSLGPFSSIAQGMFGSMISSVTNAANLNPLSKSFNSMVTSTFNSTLGSLLTNITGSSAFSSALCGMMVDTMVKYISCEMGPINMPNIGNITGSLNNLLGSGCASKAIMSSMYEAADLVADKLYTQPITVSNGLYSSTSSYSLGKSNQ